MALRLHDISVSGSELPNVSEGADPEGVGTNEELVTKPHGSKRRPRPHSLFGIIA